MGSSFDLGFASGHDAGVQRHAERSALDMMQRKFLADQYANVAAQPLPDPKADPEAYQKALDQRAKALEMQQKVYSPEHHANLFDHIHALITGKQVGADGQPVPPAAAPAPPASIAGAHPFEPHPILGKIEEGISALGKHLKAAAHPIAPAPPPDYKMLASVPTAGEREQADKLAQEEAKSEARMKEFKDKLALKPKPRDSVQKAQWDAEARKRNYTGYDDPNMTADDVESIAKGLKEASTAKTWKTVTDGDTIYAVDAHDPTKKTPIGKKSEVTETHYDAVIQQANGDLVKVPMVRYTRKGSGEKIAELPSAQAAPPQSSSAPKMPGDMSQTMVGTNIKGLVEPGNLPIWNRPTVRNADGTHSSEYSTSFQDDQGREVLVPTVVNGKFLTPDGKKPKEGSPEEKAMFKAAWQHFLDTGENLGKFDNPDDADAYSEKLHSRGSKPLASVNAGIKDANAGSKKLNKKKPVSDAAPKGPQVVGHKATPAERTTETQAAKELPVLDAAESSINDYLKNKIFDGPGDLALQHTFFTATQPSTGFRMTKVQQDILQNSQSWANSIQAKVRHATTGTWYSDEQRQQIAKAALDAIASKREALRGAMAPVSSQAPSMPGTAPKSADDYLKTIGVQ